MKQYWILLFFLTAALSMSAQTFFEKADTFFSTYVKDGKVDYSAIISDPAQLNALVDEIANLDLSNARVTPEFLKAFYVNTYNILVIRQVVDRYPIEGPLKITGFFDELKNVVMGEPMTLNYLEKEVLYSRFPDPKLHFVLVCAADGCPPLASFGYNPDSLENQLTTRTREVLNSEGFILVTSKQVQLSRIFEWYKTDFTKSNPSVIAYINEFRLNKLKQDLELAYYEYDWSLNDIN